MILSELKLFEADSKPLPPKLELKDIVKFFPNNYDRAIRQLWGKDRLTYNGMQFFDNGKLGDVYARALRAIDVWTKDESSVVNIHIPVGGEIVSEFFYDSHISDVQEVYLGYSPKTNELFVGVDAWLDESDFNEGWDAAFREATGEDYDHEDESQQAEFRKAWKVYNSMIGYGILFSVAFHAETAEVNAEIESPNGFYGGVRKLPAFKQLDLVDIRLD